MRIRVYSYFLLAVWAIVVAKPLLAYAEYSLFKNYIAENLCIKKNEANNCCKGKCYLDKQLAQSHNTSTDKRENAPKKGHQNDLKEFVKIHQFLPACFYRSHSMAYFSSAFLPTGIDQPFFVPPQG
jgi:hypothetical protein